MHYIFLVSSDSLCIFYSFFTLEFFKFFFCPSPFCRCGKPNFFLENIKEMRQRWLRLFLFRGLSGQRKKFKTFQKNTEFSKKLLSIYREATFPKISHHIPQNFSHAPQKNTTFFIFFSPLSPRMPSEGKGQTDTSYLPLKKTPHLVFFRKKKKTTFFQFIGRPHSRKFPTFTPKNQNNKTNSGPSLSWDAPLGQRANRYFVFTSNHSPVEREVQVRFLVIGPILYVVYIYNR